MPEYKLSYFPLRCRGEPIRILFHYKGVPFVDNRVTMDQWPAMKPKTPMGQLPVLEVDGRTMICQSTAIGRYVARELGLSPKNSLDMAKADMLVDGVYDMWGTLHHVYMPLLGGNQDAFKSEWAKVKSDQLPGFLDRYDKFLAANKSGWIVGDTISWADLVVTELLSVLQDCFSPDALAGHDNLKRYVEKVHNLPELKDYIAKRPKTAF